MEDLATAAAAPLLKLTPPRRKADDEEAQLDQNNNVLGIIIRSGATTSSMTTVTSVRSAYVWFALFAAILCSSWAVHHYQFENLPPPLTAEEAGAAGFSEEEAMKHVKALTELGPHTVGSDALALALQYVLAAAERIKTSISSSSSNNVDVEVEVESFDADAAAFRLSGRFDGETLAYADLTQIVLRILPKHVPEAAHNAILVSAHIDTVFSAEGAGDDTSSVAVMLELARGISQQTMGSFKNSIIFLFNTGEEEGLMGSHSFITQHPWSSTIRLAIDLEAQGLGGKSSIFQSGPLPFAVQNFASSAKYPSGQVIAQDLFTSGIINSGTDFQVYREIGNLSGLDFAFTDKSAVYHTKNDKFAQLKQGSLQHLGENMLPFLLQVAASPSLTEGKIMDDGGKSNNDTAVFFDILGQYMVVYSQGFANMLHESVIMVSLMILATYLRMGGYTAAALLVLSCLSIVLMWIFSISFSALVALSLPFISSSPVPFVASPWLVVGLFAAPAFLGALIGQSLGYLILLKYLSYVYNAKGKQQADVVKFEAERWLFKAGFLQWLIVLIAGTYYEFGSSYIPLVWLVSPAVAYGLMEATLSSDGLQRALKPETLLAGMAIPIVVSGGIFIRFAYGNAASSVRFDRNPGDSSEWVASLVVAIYIAVVICLTLGYLLSYVHLSGARSYIVIALSTCILFVVALAAVVSGIIPPFTEDTARAVNVVHVVETTGTIGEKPNSFVSLSSITPGKLTKVIDEIGEGFVCGDQVVDLVTFTPKYGCLTYDGTEEGWHEPDIPTLDVVKDTTIRNQRITQVAMDAKRSTRWVLAINTDEIQDFSLQVLVGNGVDSKEVATADGEGLSSRDGWHTIKFAGGKKAPTRFVLTLLWINNNSTLQEEEEEVRPLLKLRTDLPDLTPKAQAVLNKLPPWCSQYGKSTSPFTLSFLTSLPLH